MATYLITGGTGSLGQALVRHLLAENPANVIRVFSRDEQKQDVMRHEVGDARVRYLLGDVRDYQRLRRAFHGVDFVVHAAALKIIPVGEYNPDEVIKTNICGSENVINAAIDCGVLKVLAISSDKAVAPTNLYGNTKACMEKLVRLANGSSGTTRLSVCRYGNVVDSRGSVTHQFRAQAREGTLRVTHPEMTRFWITLPDACKFVSRAVWEMRGGDIFIPKLRACRIVSLAQSMFPEARIEYVGMRPGEKMHEWLSAVNERLVDLGWAYRAEESDRVEKPLSSENYVDDSIISTLKVAA